MKNKSAVPKVSLSMSSEYNYYSLSYGVIFNNDSTTPNVSIFLSHSHTEFLINVLLFLNFPNINSIFFTLSGANNEIFAGTSFLIVDTSKSYCYYGNFF